MGFYDDDQYVVKIKDDIYFKKDLIEMHKKWGHCEFNGKAREKFEHSEFFKLKNPGVSVIAMVLRTVPTPIRAEWKEDIKKYIKKREYYYPK